MTTSASTIHTAVANPNYSTVKVVLANGTSVHLDSMHGMRDVESALIEPFLIVETINENYMYINTSHIVSIELR